MSISSKHNEEERKSMEKVEYMRMASFDDIMNLSDIVFDVAALIRESTNSVEQQKAFAVQKDNFRINPSNVFEELGKSGLRASDRPAFQLMCNKAKQHAFDILIVDAVSRLARNVRELFDVIEDFRDLDIGIIILKERYWTYNMTHTDILRLSVDGGLAQAESMNTAKRVGQHMDQLAMDGQLLGGDMFGYRLKKGVNSMGDRIPKENKLVQEPIEALTVKTIFDLYTSDDPKEAMASNSICKYLIDNNMRTYQGDLKWTPSKVIRVLSHTKYMGYQLPGKSRVVDTVRKKKILTKVEPAKDEVSEDGATISKGNLVKINCEAIVSEEVWWKAYDRRMKRSSKNLENIRGRKSGLRVSTDALGRKAYCSCGYCLSRQYTHVATESTHANYRYKCRWQVDHASKYTIGAALKEEVIVCSNPAVSEVKLWLCEKHVFSYIFKNGKTAVLQALDIIERCKQEEEILEDGTTIQSLEEERSKLKKRLKNLQTMLGDELIDINDFKEHKLEIDNTISSIDRAIAQYELNKAKQTKRIFDIETIKERLNTIIDLKGYKVSEEMIDMFVERIIYRGIVNGNDEFLWIMNLSGEATDASSKYKIRGYDKAYADSLMDDKNFNIVARMLIPLEECQRYTETEAHRRYVKRFWRPITLKIAIV
jgi:DNA invertase Pin-like site-specific DNA recombinase